MAGGSLGDLFVTVGAKIDGFMDAMKEVQSELNNLGQKSEESSGHVESGFAGMISGVKEHAQEFQEHMEAMGKAAIGLQIVGHELSEVLTEPIKEAAEEALHAAANTEQLGIVFRTLTGSSEGATEAIEALHKFAGGSVLGLDTLEKGQQRLMAFGFAGKDAINIMKVLGGTSHAFGRGDEGVGELINTLGKIRDAGVLTQQTLKGLKQFGGTSALAEGMGISEAEVKEKAKKGIPATEGINALLTGWQQHFGGVLNQEMGGFEGMMKNIKNKIELTMDEIGQILLPIAKTIAHALSQVLDVLKGLAEWFRTLPQPVQEFALAIVAVVALAGPFLMFIGGIVLAFATVVGGIAAAVSAFIALGATMSATILIGSVVALGFAAVIGGIVAAIAAFAIWAAMHWEGVKAATASVWNGIKDIWDSTLGGVLEWATAKNNAFVGHVLPLWEDFKSGIVGIWNFIADFVTSAWDKLQSKVLDPMMNWLKAIPGVSKGLAEIAGAGSAFDKAEKESKGNSQRQDDLSLMTGGGTTIAGFHIKSNEERFKENHAAALKEQSEALERLKEDYKEGTITLEQLNAAQAKYNALVKEKGPASDAENAAKGKQKVDHNALDALTAQHAHQEALLQMKKADIAHAYQMSQLGTADKVGMDPADVETNEITTAKTRKDALDAIALQERNATLQELDAKLKLYRGDHNGYQKLLGDKTTAEDKYQAELKRNRNQQEQIVKSSNDRITAADLKSIEDDMKFENEHQKAVLRMQDQVRKAEMRAAEDSRQLQDERAGILLDKAQITQRQYLQLQQKFLDDAYQQEIKAIEAERAALKTEFGLGEMTQDTFDEKNVGLNEKQRQTTAKHQLGTVRNSAMIEKDQYEQWFKPIESSFTTGITAMIEGTKSFKQAFADMGKSILASWLQTLIQQKVAFLTHKLQELVTHHMVNEAKVASDAGAAAQSKSISLSAHFHEAMLNAKGAAMGAYKAVAGIPIIGPVLAPIAAAAAFVGVMAFSAEHGAVLPNENSIALLHPREMVLPRHLSEGIQNMISSGAAGQNINPNSYTHVPAGPMSSDIAQAIHGGAAAAATHNWGGITMHVSNTANEPLTGGKLFDSFMGEVRRRNLKMA